MWLPQYKYDTVKCDVKGLLGHFTPTTPTTLSWYSIFMKNDQSREESSRLDETV